MTGYLKLQLLATLRNKRYLIFTVGLPLILYIAITASISGPDSHKYAVAYLCSMSVFGVMGGILMTTGPAIANERKAGWLRQLRLLPISERAVFGGKIATAMATALPSLVAVALAARFLKDVHLGAGHWVELVAAIWLGSLPFAAIGVLIGYVLDGESARMASALLHSLLAFLGGLYFPVNTGGLRTVAHLLPSFRVYELGNNVIHDASVNLAGIGILAGYAVVFAGLATLRIRRSGGLSG
ncbi:MAG TPA: ABC transporter permease [Mycobacteriales bacterium]|jgi:ABC-2 type transport system permease protein|nr:ABC transporter permease [Mycobacteriales bacterium]